MTPINRISSVAGTPILIFDPFILEIDFLLLGDRII